MAYIRKFKTGSGATGVQVCWKRNGKVVKIKHVGSASSEAGLNKLLKKAEEIMHDGQGTLFDIDTYNREK